MKDKIFSGEALEEALKSEVFEQSEIELIGMVKSSEKPGHIAFARGGCETWIDMPTKMIEQAEQLGRRPCKDHWHPQFRITLKKPNNSEARILGELLAQSPIGFPSAASGLAGSNAALTRAIWGAGPPRMSPSQMAHMIRQRSGGGGVFGGGGLGFGNGDGLPCILQPVCHWEAFDDWTGLVCDWEICCWDPEVGWRCEGDPPPFPPMPEAFGKVRFGVRGAGGR
jgi:hypothetical protein